MYALTLILTVIGVVILFLKLRDVEGRLRDAEKRLYRLSRQMTEAQSSSAEETKKPEAVLVKPRKPVEEQSPPLFPEVVSGARPAAGTASSETTFIKNERTAMPKPVGTDVKPKPDPLQAAFATAANAVKDYFSGGNAVVRTGVLILLIGVGFLVNILASRGWIPIEVRLLGIASGGVVLQAIGWRLRDGRREYALALQGGGMGVLYLTLFASFRIYQLIPSAAAFVLMAAICFFMGFLSVRQRAMSLAVLGMTGGFLAPFLASTGQGSHVLLFGYYLVLNLGVFSIAWFRAWRLLNTLGFMFTFVLSGVWAGQYYRPVYFQSTEPFLILFFLFYVGISILFALRQEPRLKGLVDGTLVFGAPIVGFAYQVRLVEDMEYGLAWSAFVLGLFYIGLTWAARRFGAATMRSMGEAFLGLGVVSLTLAIPFALQDGQWTSAAWALEGAGVLWISLRQGRVLGKYFGMGMQLLAMLAFLSEPGGAASNAIFLFHLDFLGKAMLGASSLFSAYWLFRFQESLTEWERNAGRAFCALGLLWWHVGGWVEIHRYGESVPFPDLTRTLYLGLVYFALSTLALQRLGLWLKWTAIQVPALLLLPGLALTAFLCGVEAGHPWVGWPGWTIPLAVFGSYAALRWIEGLKEAEQAAPVYHAGSLWFLAVFGAWELYWRIDQGTAPAASWPWAGLVLSPAVLVLALPELRSVAWPFGKHYSSYLTFGAAPLIGLLFLWSIFINPFSDANAAPLPYLPLLNPMDAAQALAIFAGWRWFDQIKGRHASLAQRLRSRESIYAVGTLLFLWLNVMLLRSIAQWSQVIDYELSDLWRSMFVQASLTIFWSCLALSIMVFASRRHWRLLWLIGSAFLALVIVKLIAVDLGNTSGITRAISFIVSGLLFLVIGYLAPLPSGDSDSPNNAAAK